MHEEIYTCFQVTKAGILNRDAEFGVCVCVSVYVHLRRRMQRTAQLPSFYLFRHTVGTKAAGLTRQTSIWPGETLWNSAGLGAERVPSSATELLRTLCMEKGQSWSNWEEEETWQRVDQQRHKEVFKGLALQCWVSIFASMNPMWKVYTNKVLKTLNPEYEEDTAEEVQNVQLYPSLFHLLIHV